MGLCRRVMIILKKKTGIFLLLLLTIGSADAEFVTATQDVFAHPAGDATDHLALSVNKISRSR